MHILESPMSVSIDRMNAAAKDIESKRMEITPERRAELQQLCIPRFGSPCTAARMWFHACDEEWMERDTALHYIKARRWIDDNSKALLKMAKRNDDLFVARLYVEYFPFVQLLLSHPENPAEEVYLRGLLDSPVAMVKLSSVEQELDEVKRHLAASLGIEDLVKAVQEITAPKKRGNKKGEVESKRACDFCQRWESAKAAGILKKDFCKGEGISPNELDRYLQNVRDWKR